MVLSCSATTNTIGVIRLVFIAVLTPAWLVGGIALFWNGQHLLGGGAIAIGLVMLLGGYRLYRGMQRPGVVVDERSRRFHERAGYTAFWTIVLIPAFCSGLVIFLPTPFINSLVEWAGNGTQLLWGLSLAIGLIVYLSSWVYYRTVGL